MLPDISNTELTESAEPTLNLITGAELYKEKISIRIRRARNPGQLSPVFHKIQKTGTIVGKKTKPSSAPESAIAMANLIHLPACWKI